MNTQTYHREMVARVLQTLGQGLRFQGGKPASPIQHDDVMVSVDLDHVTEDRAQHTLTVFAGFPPPPEVNGWYFALRREQDGTVCRTGVTNRRGQVCWSNLERIDYLLTFETSPMSIELATPVMTRTRSRNMIADPKNQYRTQLEVAPPAFSDRVNTPWETVPDLPSFNHTAYSTIQLVLRQMTRNRTSVNPASSQGILVLGEAGAGKTHLLSRVASNLAHSNYILFVPRPNNEATLTLQVWANIILSLTQKLPDRSTDRSQLDDLLAHVFSAILIPEFEADGASEQHQRWATSLRKDPTNLFRMLGNDPKRASNNLRAIRSRTLTYLSQRHGTGIDRTIAHALITYCLVREERNRQKILAWLSGQGGLDEKDAANLGLPRDWVTVTDSVAQSEILREREAQAFRAITTLGILSTYYQPLILAFDQLEGLRGDEALTRKWGDVVREILTHAPNMLIITCVFPSLWQEWFAPRVEHSAAQRIAGRQLVLETFTPIHARELLKAHLAEAHRELRLPTPIYPFEEEEIDRLSGNARSPREFLQAARDQFEAWLFSEDLPTMELAEPAPRTPTREQIDAEIRRELERLVNQAKLNYRQGVSIEEELFGRVRHILRTCVARGDTPPQFYEASFKNRVMPLNVVVHAEKARTCFCVVNASGTALTARLRNLRELFVSKSQFDALLILRDVRCGRAGAVGRENLKALAGTPFAYIEADDLELPRLNALYELLVRIEQRDLVIEKREIDVADLLDYARRTGWFRECEIWKEAARLSPLFTEFVGV